MPSIAFTEPDMSYQDSSDDSIRRLTDDYGRHRLTDVMEADESEEDCLDYVKSSARRNRYASIGSTASSMDGLWELHPRRLSEAGLSRHSDSSAVLTEDTDSFIIGQRVWVGGTKSGTIAYIGETQFAPGDWAGIALDEPIGKNDGSVGGTRYFQCESKKGVFSRLTRLTRVPIEQPGMGSNETFTSPNNGIRRSPVSPISPTGSTRSLLKYAASLSNSNTSLASGAHIIDFKIGDRVIIKSTQGSKVGTVRYMGLTDFAPGEWVGVELDDPRGKNDGSVEGKRYFECRQNFGLFAPISKVSKSPSKYKPSACVVHSGGPGLPPSGLKRTNSKESMTSMASKTSAASSVRRVRLGVTSLTPKKVTPKTSTPIPTRTALQDVLREKQQHIEQLLKERDLERAEITRAASQADDAEHRLITLTKEYHKHLAECESKVRVDHEVLAKLKVDREQLLNQLEDEKRKNEDLQFRFEEAAIGKSDIEANVLAQNVVNASFVKRIDQLEANLAEEHKKAESLEQTSNKLFEAEENLIKSREEIDALKQELDDSRKGRAAVEEKDVASVQLIDSLKKQIESSNTQNKEKEKQIQELHDEITKIRNEREIVERAVDESKKKVEESCEEKDTLIAKLHSELAEQKKIIEKYEKTNDNLGKENEKLKMDLSAKTHDVEVLKEKLTTIEEEMKLAHKNLEEVKKEFNEKTSDFDRHQVHSRQIEDDLRKELQQTRDDLKNKISEVEVAKREAEVQITQKDKQLEEANKKIIQHSEVIKKLQSEVTENKTAHEDIKNEINSRHSRQIESQEAQLMALAAEIQQKNEEITKSSIVISKLEEDLCAKNGVIEQLRLELESHESQKTEHETESTTWGKRLQDLTLMNGDLERQLTVANQRIEELTVVKQRLDTQIQSLLVQCEGAAQLEQLRSEIQIKENMMIELRNEYDAKIQVCERQRHELQLQSEAEISKLVAIRLDLEKKLQLAIQSEGVLKERSDSTLADLSKIREEYVVKINEMTQTIQEKNLEIINIQTKCTDTTNHYQEQLKLVGGEYERNLQDYQQKMTLLNEENAQLKVQITQNSEQIIEAKSEASHILAQCQQTEKELNQKCSEDVRKLEFELQGKDALLQKAQTEIELLKSDCQSTETDTISKDTRISELVVELRQSQDLITQLQQQLSSAQESCEKGRQEHDLVQNQCQGLFDRIADLTQQVQNSDEMFKKLQFEHKNYMLVMQQLRITAEEKQQCLLQLQNVAGDLAEGNKCEHALNILNQIKVGENEYLEQHLNSQKQVESLRNQLAECNNLYNVQQKELLQLQEELIKAQEALNSKVTVVQQDSNSLIQDKELAENQIRFLNTIIVDIQRKNEEQRAKIEILEAGCSPAMDEDFKSLSRVGRQIPPRMYCDICEEFDLHDTEDCPKQTSDDVPANGTRLPRNLHEDRPYCEICEEFGHATEDCKEDQTF